MTHLRLLVSLTLISACSCRALAQFNPGDIKIFGYFQTSFRHTTRLADEPEQNTFNLQQLNLFFQKDLSQNWTAFINFEFLNNFSSSRQWGSANLEEAWLKYRSGREFNLKLGLQIPIFNNLNEIKNRTPLLPYIVRPLVYETSFSEFIAVEEYLPTRAYIQAYGFCQLSTETKLDYAVYIGNSPNISTPRPDSLGNFQTGVDTTDTFLVGGRVGVRFRELKVGASATLDNVNYFKGVEIFVGGSPSRFDEIRRFRLGGDLSYNLGPVSLESEFIRVTYDDDIEEASLDKSFFYATLGYHLNDRLFVYGSCWFEQEDITDTDIDGSGKRVLVNGASDVKVPTFGFSYNLNDRITFKGQFARVWLDFKQLDVVIPSVDHTFKDTSNNYTAGVSVFF
ncbi:MAG TPA: hypothetical protein VGA99_02245 [bacterium]